MAAPPAAAVPSPGPQYLLTTSFGIADVVVKELRDGTRGTGCDATPAALQPIEEGARATMQVAGAEVAVTVAPFGLINTVMLEPLGGTPDTHDALVSRLRGLRSIHDVLLYHGSFALPAEGEFANQPLEIYNILKDPACGIDVHTLKGAPHFRVSCERTGTHKFHASDVEMEAGGAFHERYQIPAKMKKFKVCVRVDVHINTVLVSTLLNDTPDHVPYSKRHKLAFVRTVTLKPNVAYAMLQLSGVKDGDLILDPFVGSGTILLEALELYPNVKCRGLDRSGAAVRGSAANAVAAGLADRVSFVQGNARTLHKSFDFQFDKIISNFPWGLKTGSTADIKELYRGAIASCWGALKPGGILTCIVLHDYVTLSLFRTSGNWEVLHARVAKTGGKLPGIIVARKKEQDTVFRALKTQRANLYRYIQNHAVKEGEKGSEADPEEAEEDDADMSDAPADDPTVRRSGKGGKKEGGKKGSRGGKGKGGAKANQEKAKDVAAE